MHLTRQHVGQDACDRHMHVRATEQPCLVPSTSFAHVSGLDEHHHTFCELELRHVPALAFGSNMR
eukprot:6952917-Prymnesium_polylepis.1